MKIFKKNGKILPKNQIVIMTEDSQIINPSISLLLEDGWVEWNSQELSVDTQMQRLKESKLDDIIKYDSSSAVNEFSVQGYGIWLDKATRAGLKLRFEAEQKAGIAETALWYNGVQFPIPVELGIQILLAVELYASACYDNTQKHMANVQALTTVEEVEAYDYTTGYPEKLSF